MNPPGNIPPVVIVELYQTPKPNRWNPKRRHQSWRWRAISAGNSRVLASGEAFTNRNDAMRSVYVLFGEGSTVMLRQKEFGLVALRRPVE